MSGQSTSATTQDGSNRSEADRILDEWVEASKERVGQRHYPFRGQTPPDPRVAYHAAWNNRDVTADLIRHYADAMGDKNPLWRSEEYAGRTRWGGIVAPPTFLDAISVTAVHDRRFIPKDARAYIAGSDRRWFHPIRPGDQIQVSDTYLGVEEKSVKDKPYRLFIETVRRSYTRQDGEVVAVADSPCIIMGPNKGEKIAPFADRQLYKYTDEEIAAFREKMKSHTRRGRETLFWEDVSEGETLPELVPGPVDATEVWIYLGVLSYMGAFDIRWDMMDDDPSFSLRNPDTNLPRTGDLIHLLPDHARVRANSIPFASAGQSEGLLCRMICDWMGDDGMLKRLSCKAKRPNYLGDVSTMSGKVVRKYEENGEYLVDLEVACTNQLGVTHMPGEATVSLVSRGASL